ncbi:hypothetical protein Phum_PHUM196790 [Pediculus humanus corporis]|uniref:Uncharacterized protein n=1 Tax=Pediculus humanus subsp. corporis TaxID=121224 RepID=E0VH08_PEDHC|nr:uncharacterized protein Phum_PHUM196790 [Pediculus humanus corporis]EEB12664.1 hypothetical protein Phum_PHUM196790 [Pediculus humanus corporis]
MEDNEHRIYLDAINFRGKCYDVIDEWNSSNNDSNTIEKYSILSEKSNESPNAASSSKSKTKIINDVKKLDQSNHMNVAQETKNFGKKNLTDQQPQLIEMKREKNLKVQSFIRNLGIRLMKTFHFKKS